MISCLTAKMLKYQVWVQNHVSTLPQGIFRPVQGDSYAVLYICRVNEILFLQSAGINNNALFSQFTDRKFYRWAESPTYMLIIMRLLANFTGRKLSYIVGLKAQPTCSTSENILSFYAVRHDIMPYC